MTFSHFLFFNMISSLKMVSYYILKIEKSYFTNKVNRKMVLLEKSVSCHKSILIVWNIVKYHPTGNCAFVVYSSSC